MKRDEKEWHDRLYQENLGERSKIMPFYEVARKARERFYRLLLELTGPGLKVLDYGCGTGEFALSVAERGAQDIGIDISRLFAKQKRKQGEDELSRKRFF